MMIPVSISIHGFKSIRNAHFHLTPVNVLIGANGSGKSNFIDFFRMLRAIMNLRNTDLPESSLSAYIKDKGGIRNILFNGPKTTKHISGSI